MKKVDYYKYRITIFLLSLFIIIVIAESKAEDIVSPHIFNDSIISSFKPAIDSFPNFEVAIHDIGNIDYYITNLGRIGSSGYDAEAGKYRGSVYPKNSNISYDGIVKLLIGGIIGKDTLVSSPSIYTSPGTEFSPDFGEDGEVIYRSITLSSPYGNIKALSEQDFICSYTDTITNPAITGIDSYDNRPHKPLNVSITQSSYAWSAAETDDFVIIDYQITNIGERRIDSMYIGFWANCNVFAGGDIEYQVRNPHNIVGYLKETDLPPGLCQEKDTVNIAWWADNDGHPNESGQWDNKSIRGIMGIQLLRPTPEEINVNYNWLVGFRNNRYWSPRLAPTRQDPWWDYGYNFPFPYGDRNKFYMMSHPEFDYDYMYLALDHTNEGYMPRMPVNEVDEIAAGAWPKSLLSIGPYDVAPGDTVPVTIAIVAGDNFHVNPDDFQNYWDPFNPDIYYSKLDFSEIVENARWARAVFDNPGVDTDGNEYSGEFCWIYHTVDDEIVDSTKRYYSGDGVPDFRAFTPPPPPIVTTYPEYGKVTIRWSGQDSETTPDLFTGNIDFEGYRVYMAEDNRLTDFVLLHSYDIEDYAVYAFDDTRLIWQKIGARATIDSLRVVHGSDFDPTNYYDQFNYFNDHISNQYLYFTPQDYNNSQLSQYGIHKVYPNASPDDPTDVTEDGYMRCYEYEYVIDNLHPSVEYYFGVTAFDAGATNFDIGMLETSPLTNAVREFALPSSKTVEQKGLNVFVWPNPYRTDGGYVRAGYENRERSISNERAREIHFANLPPICTIRIYTLSGDLVRELKHYYPEGDPASQEETWNVISRNTQAVVTGLYIWHVRSDMGEQIGKLVIMK